MNDDRRRRRRRGSESSSRRSRPSSAATPWLITIAAAIAVVAGGWFLGQALAHAFGANDRQSAQTAPTSLPLVTPAASPVASPSETPATSAPSPTPAAEATSAPTPTHAVVAVATPAPSPSPMATRTPTPAPATASPAPRLGHTSLPARTPLPSHAASTPAPVAQTASTAQETVRAYIAALERGDPQTAAQYLGNGVPDESFIDSKTRIENISETAHADGSSTVQVDMQTSAGRYRESFEVAPGSGGSRILQKSAAKQ